MTKKVGKREINKQIVQKFRNYIRAIGLEGELNVFPVENVATKRARFWEDGDGYWMKILMWSVNTLDNQELEQEIEARVAEAVCYFDLEPKK